jgi:hypothetical protein
VLPRHRFALPCLVKLLAASPRTLSSIVSSQIASVSNVLTVAESMSNTVPRDGYVGGQTRMTVGDP